MEPVNPSPEYPTGVQTFQTLSFRSAEDFREKASFLIEKWAIDRIHADTRLRLTPRVLLCREDAVNGLLIGKAGGIRLRIDSNMEAMLLHLQGDGISVSEAVASGEVNVLAAGRLLGAMETLFEKGRWFWEPGGQCRRIWRRGGDATGRWLSSRAALLDG